MRVKKVVPKVMQKTYSSIEVTCPYCRAVLQGNMINKDVTIRFKCWGPNCGKIVELDWGGVNNERTH
jgi:lysyl-tRNA synthetase class I